MNCRSRLQLIATTVFVVATTCHAAVAEDLRQSTSLKLIPADAAVYITSLRNREIFEIAFHSKAAKKFTEMSVYDMLRGPLREPLGEFQKALGDPANKQLFELIIEMLSDEIFMYGSGEWVDFGRLMQEVNRAQQLGQITGALDQLGMGVGTGDPQRDQIAAIMDSLNENLDRLEVPDTVVGFKVKDQQAALAQMDRLEGLLTAVLADVKELQGKLKREKIGKQEFLTLQVDGSMVPWDEVPWNEIEADEGQYQKLVEKLKTMTAVVSLGVVGDYVMLSVGNSNEHLAKLGQGPLLADREELARLKDYADRRLVEISYASREMMAAAVMSRQDLDEFKGLADSLVPEDLDDTLKKRIQSDVNELLDDMGESLAEPGAMLDFSFLTDTGFEGYSYSWAQNGMLDGSQPLTLLNHVGGNPILFVVARGVQSPGDYDLMVKWLKKAHAYAEEFGIRELDDQQRQQYAQIKKKMVPLLKRIHKANRKMLIPALQDGQVGLVVDARTSSKQWHPAMPVSDNPLPMLEMALVCGVTDAKLLKKGVAEYFVAINKVLGMMHELQPEEIPELTLPAPQTEKLRGGTGYSYPLPAALGLDKAIAPNAGLSDHVAVVSMTPGQTRRLLKETPLTVGSPPLADTNRPLAIAASCNFAALIHAIEPWVDYGFDLAMQDYNPEEDSFPLPAVRDEVKTSLQILRCFRGVSAASYFEDGVLVTHSEWNFVDLEE